MQFGLALNRRFKAVDRKRRAVPHPSSRRFLRDGTKPLWREL